MTAIPRGYEALRTNTNVTTPGSGCLMTGQHESEDSDCGLSSLGQNRERKSQSAMDPVNSWGLDYCYAYDKEEPWPFSGSTVHVQFENFKDRLSIRLMGDGYHLFLSFQLGIRMLVILVRMATKYPEPTYSGIDAL